MTGFGFRDFGGMVLGSVCKVSRNAELTHRADVDIAFQTSKSMR